MRPSMMLTRHAHKRSTGRAIPPGVARLIRDYGEVREAGGGAHRFALSGSSMAELRREWGPEIAKAIEPFRKRNAYVVAEGDQIITVAFASRPQKRD